MPKDKLVSLPCKIEHYVHRKCWYDYSSLRKKNDMPLDCPLCIPNHTFELGVQFAKIVIVKSDLRLLLCN
jgi:hypothetical protein